MSVASLSRDLQIQMGSVGGALTDRGAYAALTSYAVDDCCSSGGVTYRALVSTTGDTPATSPTKWAVMPGAGATSVTLVSLSDSLLSAARTLVSDRAARRVGLLEAVFEPAALPCVTSAGSIGEGWNENLEAKAFLASVVANDAALSGFRVVDPQVRAALTAPIGVTRLNAIGAGLVTLADQYADLAAAELPA